jgi:ATP-dependent Clp protease adapter protein ClpS
MLQARCRLLQAGRGMLQVHKEGNLLCTRCRLLQAGRGMLQVS